MRGIPIFSNWYIQKEILKNSLLVHFVHSSIQFSLRSTKWLLLVRYAHYSFTSFTHPFSFHFIQLNGYFLLAHYHSLIYLVISNSLYRKYWKNTLSKFYPYTQIFKLIYTKIPKVNITYSLTSFVHPFSLHYSLTQYSSLSFTILNIVQLNGIHRIGPLI